MRPVGGLGRRGGEGERGCGDNMGIQCDLVY